MGWVVINDKFAWDSFLIPVKEDVQVIIERPKDKLVYKVLSGSLRKYTPIFPAISLKHKSSRNASEYLVSSLIMVTRELGWDESLNFKNLSSLAYDQYSLYKKLKSDGIDFYKIVDDFKKHFKEYTKEELLVYLKLMYPDFDNLNTLFKILYSLKEDFSV